MRGEKDEEVALNAAIRAGGWDLFDPDTRQACKDFMAGRPNPIIDKLREECLAIEAGEKVTDER